MQFDHQRGEHFSFEGADLYVETIGEENAPPLLLLHGGIGTIEDFNSLVPLFAKQYRLIGIDSRGHGRSSLGGSDLTYRRLEEDAFEVLKQLGIAGAELSIIGFSDGGIVGYRLMARQDLKVTRLVTIGAPAELRPDDPVNDIYSKVTAATMKENFPEVDELYQKLNPAPNFDRFVSLSTKMWLDASNYPGDTVETLQGEVLILRGDNDHLFARRDAAELADKIKSAALANIPFAGHAAHEDQSEITQQLLKQFFSLSSA